MTKDVKFLGAGFEPEVTSNNKSEAAENIEELCQGMRMKIVGTERRMKPRTEGGDKTGI